MPGIVIRAFDLPEAVHEARERQRSKRTGWLSGSGDARGSHDGAKGGVRDGSVETAGADAGQCPISKYLLV